MDGTVLNDKKEMDELTQRAIHEALAEGKEVVFCTGRSVAEMQHFLQLFPDMHYLLCESGALIYDLQSRTSLLRETIPDDAVDALRETAAGRDIMPNVFSEGNNCLNRRQAYSLADYGMGPYQETIPQIAIYYEDVFADEFLVPFHFPLFGDGSWVDGLFPGFAGREHGFQAFVFPGDVLDAIVFVFGFLGAEFFDETVEGDERGGVAGPGFGEPGC
jgi:hypothetical protein